MLKMMTLYRKRAKRDNSEVFDVVERLAKDQFGSAANAMIQCVRASGPYAAMLQKMRSEGYGVDRRTEGDAVDGDSVEPASPVTRGSARQGRKAAVRGASR